MAKRRADKIGTLLFCPECGTLLSLPLDDNSTYVECEQCQYHEPASSYENLEVTTVSTLESIPSPLRLKRTTRTRAHIGGEVDTKSNEECPKCGHRESTYKEKQMRSADEGATLIYSCLNPECKHTWRQNG
ncbi:DNA-directed RNA polymerase I kDa polypeptide [Calocera cornea HHB12733]|uniref:DNA-directed RNA polymerase subunit n=1 Tax=Calocera cornea HHB12733 TaxID=1353952 RepID=A0A165CSY7_9BASI|nr:DNA-directed RNA polymerase I kDa polypeptide [Calocera cornea HHB12733]